MVRWSCHAFSLRCVVVVVVGGVEEIGVVILCGSKDKCIYQLQSIMKQMNFLGKLFK